MNYPIFRNPQEYLSFRKDNFLYAPFKEWFEWRAVSRCLQGRKDIKTVCDCPCGPGRIFSFWQKKGFDVIGIDLSEQMAEAAQKLHKEMKLGGRIIKGDAFKLEKFLDDKPDLIASVRFFYYFEKEIRIRLLKCFAKATGKYVLIQYKTGQTIKGIFNKQKAKKSPYPKKFCSFDTIIDELRQAGLACLRIQPIAETSDRVFVLAQKPDESCTLNHKPAIKWQGYQIKFYKLAVAAVVLFTAFFSPLKYIVLDTHEHEIEHIVRAYQDGNDHFYVSDTAFLEDLRCSRRLSFLNDTSQAEGFVKTDQFEKEDSFFIVSADDADRLQKSPLWKNLYVLKKLKIAGSRFYLLSTEVSRIPGKTSILIEHLSLYS